MSDSIEKLIKRVTVLFDDQQQDWCDKDYVLNWLDIANDDLETMLVSVGLQYDEDIVIIPAVPANTTDLSTYQADGGPLDTMIVPTFLEWRLVGQTDQQWNPVDRQDKIIDTLAGNSASVTQGIASYTYRKRIIQISASEVPVDLRVTAEFLPPPLDSDSDQFINGTINCLAYMVAHAIAVTRNGESSKLALYFAAKMEARVDDIICALVQADQETTRRLPGRRSALRGYPNGWPDGSVVFQNKS